jgi:hypothetical protein
MPTWPQFASIEVTDIAYFGDRDAMYAIDNRAGQGDPASGSNAG